MTFPWILYCCGGSLYCSYCRQPLAETFRLMKIDANGAAELTAYPVTHLDLSCSAPWTESKKRASVQPLL